MGNKEKFIERIKRKDISITFIEMNSFLLSVGFYCREGGGSHRIYIHKDYPRLRIVIAAHGNGQELKLYNIKDVKNVLEEMSIIE